MKYTVIILAIQKFKNSYLLSLENSTDGDRYLGNQINNLDCQPEYLDSLINTLCSWIDFLDSQIIRQRLPYRPFRSSDIMLNSEINDPNSQTDNLDGQMYI